jgi:concentrative nucleoside transporter, CNT family
VFIIQPFLPYFKNITLMALIFVIAYLCSVDRSNISLRTLLGAFGLQWFLGIVALKTSVGKWMYHGLSLCVDLLNTSVDQSLYLLFGKLSDAQGLWGSIYCVKVIPLLIFMGAFFTVLFHWGLIQRVASIIARGLYAVVHVSAVELVCVQLNAFLGQLVTPLLMKKYMRTMTPSQIFVYMVSGMALLNIALIVIYASMGVPLMHLLGAVLMGIPGSIMIAKIVYPDAPGHTPQPELSFDGTSMYRSSWDALYNGTLDGIKIGSGTVAMLITCVSMIAMMNFICARTIGLSLDQIFSYVFAPVAYLIGIPLIELLDTGMLVGQKTVINEYVAYTSMGKMLFSERSTMLLTYALAGFANFTSVGVQVATMGAFAPEQRPTVVRLGMRALLGAVLVNLMNAAIAGVLN